MIRTQYFELKELFFEKNINIQSSIDFRRNFQFLVSNLIEKY